MHQTIDLTDLPIDAAMAVAGREFLAAITAGLVQVAMAFAAAPAITTPKANASPILLMRDPVMLLAAATSRRRAGFRAVGIFL
jgi:hypothetical protein